VGYGTPSASAEVGATATPIQVARAWAQHHVAMSLRDVLREAGLSAEELARILGQGPATLRDKLSGRTWCTLEDLIGWALVVGDAPLKAWASGIESLFPQNYWPLPASWQPGSLSLPSSGEVGASIRWARVARELHERVLRDRRAGEGHLLDDAALSRIAREVLFGSGVAAADLALRRATGANVFDVAPASCVATVWGRDPETSASAEELRQRIADAFVALAVSGREELVILAVLEPAATAVAARMLGDANEFTLVWEDVASAASVSVLPMPDAQGRRAVANDADGFKAIVWLFGK
jgi:hypothetical protein